jgi:tRNA pseudouridine65 synthase
LHLDILYQDETICAINKPHGLLVHQSPIARDADIFALQLLRDQLGQLVYPAHRIDRKTGGVLLFALDEDTNKKLPQLFAENLMDKVYLAIVRGYTEDKGEIDYDLTREDGKVQEAFTKYETIDRVELPVPLGAHTTSRYSLVKVFPQTGRMHQIRKHLAHIHHPIIGDRPHGCNKQNRLFKNKWEMDTMMLHAYKLSFPHPTTKEVVHLEAPLQSEFNRMITLMGWNETSLEEVIPGHQIT